MYYILNLKVITIGKQQQIHILSYKDLQYTK